MKHQHKGAPAGPRQKRRDRGDKTSPDLPPGIFRIYDFPSLSEYLQFAPSHVLRIRTVAKLRGRVADMVASLAPKSDLRVEIAAEEDEGFARSEAGEPLYAEIKVLSHDEDDLLQRVAQENPRLIVLLDHISDPRNLGAIVRSAAFFGIKEVVAPERRQVLVTEAGLATARGGFAISRFSVVKNLNRTIEKLKEMGYWVAGADMGGDPLAGQGKKYDRLVLVLGAEGNGLSALVKKNCDFFLSIPASAQSLESLNVSVAAGILFYELTKS